MPSFPTHHIPQTLIGLVLWLWWATGAFAYSNPHPAHEFATVCHLGSTHSYNTAGDPTTDGQRTYTYNSQQRLATTHLNPTTANPNPAKTNYLYNALGQRVFKTDPIFGTPTADNQKLGWAYLYDETGTLLGEYGMGGAASSGSTEHIYLPTAAGPLPVATIINGQHYAVHTDHLNTPRRLTAANNQAVWQWAYSAFGQEQATTANKRFTSTNTIPATGTTTAQPVAYHQRYPGQSFDVESGLHYNYFRSYDLQIGRYTQADPIGLSGGWNRYAYVSGNPLNAIDPFGLAEDMAMRQMIGQPGYSVGGPQFSYNPNDVRGGFDTDGRSLVYNPRYYDPDAASRLLLTAAMLIAPEFVAAGRAAGAICAAKGLNIADFSEVGALISNKQLRHIAGRPELTARGGGGFLDSMADAQAVLDAYRSGSATILGRSSQGFPVVRVNGISGTNVNIGAGIANQPTNVFIIKGTAHPSVVPTNPNWIPR